MKEMYVFYANISKMGNRKIIIVPARLRDNVDVGEQVLVITNPYTAPIKLVKDVYMEWIGNETVSIQCAKGEILHMHVSKELGEKLKKITTPARADIFLAALMEIADEISNVEELKTIVNVARKVLLHCIIY